MPYRFFFWFGSVVVGGTGIYLISLFFGHGRARGRGRWVGRRKGEGVGTKKKRTPLIGRPLVHEPLGVD